MFTDLLLIFNIGLLVWLAFQLDIIERRLIDIERDRR